MSDIDDEMLNDFIEESEELLDSIEEDFLSLETAGNDSELINRLFRAVHTIKGTAIKADIVLYRTCNFRSPYANCK